MSTEVLAVDHRDPAVAAQLAALQRASYAVEAHIIGSDAIPSLHESPAEIQALDLHVLATTHDGAIIAALGYRIDGDTVDIDRLAVHPDHFRCGHARRLVAAVHARASNARRVVVSTGAANKPAVRLYESLGYRATGDEALPEGITVRRFEREVPRWEPFTVDQVAALMRGARCDWWLSGGHAVDRIAGRVVRTHGDIDISVRADHWPVFAAHVSNQLECFLARDGVLTPIVGDGAGGHNIWAREPGTTAWRLQVNLEPVVAGDWRYRRDPRVHRPIDAAVETRGDTPCVRAAVQLLWKSKDPQPKDELDFDAVIGTLTIEDRAWLAASIGRAHPESPWKARVT